MTLQSTIIRCLAELQNRLLKRVDQYLSVHGISFSEFLVLYHLSQAPNMTMRRIDLAECIGLTASGVTRLLNPMEKKPPCAERIQPSRRTGQSCKIDRNRKMPAARRNRDIRIEC